VVSGLESRGCGTRTRGFVATVRIDRAIVWAWRLVTLQRDLLAGKLPRFLAPLALSAFGGVLFAANCRSSGSLRRPAYWPANRGGPKQWRRMHGLWTFA